MINDIDNGLVSKILKSADDPKLCKVVVMQEDSVLTREDLGQGLADALKHSEKSCFMHMGEKRQHSSNMAWISNFESLRGGEGPRSGHAQQF